MAFVLETAEQITAALDDIILGVFPDASRRPMYGGIVFATEADNHASMVCGHFVYKQHVSLEFSNGKLLDDPQGVLEGKGKYRRHIKLRSIDDIEIKAVRSILEQAFSVQISPGTT